MTIRSARFISSVANWKDCPPPHQPEFAFIGRSNVGKSSLINMLVGQKGLAKISAKPGKTQTINHFKINEQWYMVDLPGYGYASVSKSARFAWGKMIEDYLKQRTNLYCTFVLLDSRLEPQAIDLDFISWIGQQKLPIALILTKTDKLKRQELARSIQGYERALGAKWSELPPIFITSAETQTGKEEILEFIDNALPG